MGAKPFVWDGFKGILKEKLNDLILTKKKKVCSCSTKIEVLNIGK